MKVFIALLAFLLPAVGVAAECAPLTPGTSEHEMRHGVLTRSYRVYVPENVPPDNRVLVVGMHGGWGTGKVFAEQAHLKAEADRTGFILALPDGFRRSWNAGSCCGPAAENKVDDVGFIQSMVKIARGTYCVDADKVYGTGFSNGAMLTHRIRCEAPDVFAAIAPVSGGPMIESCAAGKAVPALLIQGREDPRIFWDGGTFDGTFRPSMASVVDKIGRLNGCDAASTKALQSNAGCSRRSCGKAPLEWCGVPKVGHQWPGGKSYWPDKLGPNRSDVDATGMIFRFFQDQANAPGS